MDAGDSRNATTTSPLRTRRGPLPPVQLSNSMRNTQLVDVGGDPCAELHLPSITGNTEKTTQALCPSPLRPARTGSALHGNAAAMDIDAIERCPSPVLQGAAYRRKSLSPAKQRVGSGMSPSSLRMQQRSPEPLRRIVSAESSSTDDIPAIYLNNSSGGSGEPGAGFRSSSSSESLGESSATSSSSSSGNAFRSTRGGGGSTTSSHLATLRDFSSLSRSLPSLTEEEAPRRSSVPTVNRALLGASLPRSGSFDSEIGGGASSSSMSSRMRCRHSNPTLASKSLASMASPMASRRRTRHSPTPLGLGDLSPDMAAGMLYSKEVPSSRRRSKTVSPEPIPEDDVAPSPSLPRRRSPSPQPPVHASGIPVSPLATMGGCGGAGGGGVPTRHVSLPGSFQMVATSPRRSRPNNVNILARSMSPARATSLDSAEEQSLTALSPVKELDADDEDTDGGGCGGGGGAMAGGHGHARSSRSKSYGEIEAFRSAGVGGPALAMPAIQSHMPKAVTMDDLQAARRLLPAAVAVTKTAAPPCSSVFAEDDEEEDGDAEQ